VTPLGQALRAARSARRISLKQHAARVGVSPAYISALEHGHRGLPTQTMLQRILAALRLEPSETGRLEALVHISRPRIVLDASGMDPRRTELANRFADLFPDLTSDQTEHLLGVLRTVDTAAAANRDTAAPL
jgi:transcriptional regulator with XRE-family HTH domain